MKRFEKLLIALMVGLFGFTAGAPAQADLDLSQSPLFLISPVKPALIMGMDNSGSMDGEMIMPSNDGAMWWHTGDNSFTGRGVTANGQNNTIETGRLNFNAAGGANGTWKKYVYLFPNGADGSGGFRRQYSDSNNDHYAVPPIPAFAYARSPAFNAIYFDPNEDYPPFPSAGSDAYADANPTSAYYDEARGAGTTDLTIPRLDTQGNWVFKMFRGMRIPAGTIVAPADGDECALEDGAGNDVNYNATGSTTLAIEALVDEDDCEMGIEYFPATFWLPADEAPPSSFGFDLSMRLSGGLTPDGQPMYGYEIKPGNFSSTAAYNEAIQSFANWFSYYRKRSLLTRAAIGRSFEEVNFLRAGFFRINNRNDVTMRDLGDAVDRKEFFDWQYDLRGTGGTPNREAVKHIGDQFNTQSGANAPILQACQRNFGMLVTDGFANAWTGAGVGNTDGSGSPLAGTFLADDESNTMADIAYRYYNTHLRSGQIAGGKVPVPSACSQANPPLELDCQKDPHMNLFAVALGAKGLVFGVDEDASEDPYANNPDWPTSFQNRNPTAIDDLWHATLNTRGEMFSATRPQELVRVLTEVLREIASRIEPVGVSATSTRLDEDTQFFESELDSTTWSGNLRAIDANTGAVNWDAESQLPVLYTNRTIKTSIGGASANFTTSALVRTAIFGPGSIIGEDEQDRIINYLRGDQDNEQPDGSLRERDGVIGDIANSRPTFVGPVNEGWGREYSNYLEYVNGAKQNLNLVLVGANDGMLHAFDSDSGDEEFAYIPSMVHENLAQLADPDYVHRFYVDGQIGIGDVLDGGWTTVAVAGLGAGGKGVVALDLRTGEPLWEITPDDSIVGDDIGHVFGKPVITRAGDEWVAIFGNGYNSTNGRAGLIVVDIKTGVAQPLVETMPSDTDNGLSEVAVFMDPVDSVNVLRAYAGDLKGNMWRFDFDGGTVPASEFGTNPLINIDDDRPITAAPTLAALPSGGIMVFFGTGKLLETADRVGTPLDFDTFYAVRDRNTAFNNTNNLAVATMTSEAGGRSITGVDGATNGWKLDLGIGSNETGERVLAKPAVTFGRLIFTTFEPDDDPCAPGGIRRIYLLNALNASGQFETDDCVNCGVIEVGLGAPIDPAIIIRPPGDSDRFDNDDPPPPFNPGDGTLPDGSTVGSVTRWCSTLLIQVAGQGQVPIGNVCDGRQVWRQAR